MRYSVWFVLNDAKEARTVPDYHPVQADLLSQKDAQPVCTSLTAVTLTGTLAVLNRSLDKHVSLHINAQSKQNLDAVARGLANSYLEIDKSMRDQSFFEDDSSGYHDYYEPPPCHASTLVTQLYLQLHGRDRFYQQVSHFSCKLWCV